MRLIRVTQLTSTSNGVQAHDQSGNASSQVGGAIGVRIAGEQMLVSLDGSRVTPARVPPREQLFHRRGVPVVAESLNVMFPTVTADANDAGYNWTIVPSAENDLDKHGGIIWLRRRSWPRNPTRISPQWFARVSLETKTVLDVVPVADLSKELDTNRRHEIHACHQANGHLLFMHERERLGAYDRATFAKQWYWIGPTRETVVVGKNMDHPAWRNDWMLFTTGNGLSHRYGAEWIRFEDGVSCMHQFLDGQGHVVCSMQRRNSVGWVEFEIRVIDLETKLTVATVPLHQKNQSEAGEQFALLSRPFGFVHESKYYVCYHEPAEADWAKPIQQRVPQVWVAEFEYEQVPANDLAARVAILESQVRELQVDMARPMEVVRK